VRFSILVQEKTAFGRAATTIRQCCPFVVNGPTRFDDGSRINIKIRGS
jgi:hypothetical protein